MLDDVPREDEKSLVSIRGEVPEGVDLVLADLKRVADQGMQDLSDDMAKLPSYFQGELKRIAVRSPHHGGHNYGAAEEPGYFDKARADRAERSAA